MNLTRDYKVIRDFITDFFLANGARILESSKELLRFKVTKRLQQELGIAKEEVKLAFPPFDESLQEDVEPILPGSHLFDKILKAARERGKTTRMRLNPGDSAQRVYEEAISRLRIQNVESTKTDLEIFDSSYILFNFLVTYTSDEKKEEFCSIVVDFLTGEIRKDHKDWFKEVELVDEDSKFVVPISSGDIEQLYVEACKEIRNQIAKTAKEFIGKSNERFAKEVSRIDSYYSTRAREVRDSIKVSEEKIVEAFYKLKIAKVREDEEEAERNYARYREELEAFKSKAEKDLMALEEERRRRISEESEKYNPKLQVELINSAIISIPKFHQKLILKNGPVSKVVDLIFDVASERLENISCERCGSILEKAYLCSGGHLVCSSCTNICRICGRAMCSDCYITRCEICNATICKACSRRCLACGLVTCTEHSHACEECREEFCERCTFICEVCGKSFCGAHVLECFRCKKPVCFEDSEECVVCGKTFCKDYIVYCATCGAPLCRDDALSCSVCGRNLCEKHGHSCLLCGEILCSQDSGKCNICGEVYCLKDLKECSACLNSYCTLNSRRCSRCGQEYCSQCISDNLCTACQSLKRVQRNHGIIQSLSMRRYKEISIDKFWFWEIGENEREYHIFAMHLLRNYIFIVDKETIEIKMCLRENIFPSLLRLFKRGANLISSAILLRK